MRIPIGTVDKSVCESYICSDVGFTTQVMRLRMWAESAGCESFRSKQGLPITYPKYDHPNCRNPKEGSGGNSHVGATFKPWIHEFVGFRSD